MAGLDEGQAIFGGDNWYEYQKKIYFLTCSNRNCKIEALTKELSVPKSGIMAIPIPDTIAECISSGKK